jgi:hypothetical protein
MTPNQKAKMHFWHYESGLKYGGEVALTIIADHPDGFDTDRCEQLAAEIGQKLSGAITVLDKRCCDSFSAGYYLSIRTAFDKHREALILIACQGSK